MHGQFTRELVVLTVIVSTLSSDSVACKRISGKSLQPGDSRCRSPETLSVDKEESVPGRLDKLFLESHNCFPPLSLPFLHDLHEEVSRSWRKSYSWQWHGILTEGSSLAL